MFRIASLASLCALIAPHIQAQSTPNQVHASPQADPGVYSGRLKVDYPTAYEPATADQIREVLERVHAYVEQAAPVAVIDGATGQAAELAHLPADAALARTDLQILSYEWGVTYAGMLLTAEITGDTRYRVYTDERVSALAALASNARAHLAAGTTAANFPRPAHGISLRPMLMPRALDDSGAMCAALIKAERAGLGGGKLRPWIDVWVRYVSSGQFRLADGTLARNRPLPKSLWLDDLYMSVPCLAQAGKLTGERRYYDDAARQVLQYADRMFVPERGLFMHGWVEGMSAHPEFHWARANGWALMAMTELLDVLPADHPGRKDVLEQFRAHVKGLAAYQTGKGFWHQLLDRNDSYLETSATAIYTYCMARGINNGWIDAKAYGPACLLGWSAVSTKVTAIGQVEGTCVGTGMAFDPAFYYYRPVNVFAAHGYGPVLLAGSEIINLLKQYNFEFNDSSIQLTGKK